MRHAFAAILAVLALSACGGSKESGITGSSEIPASTTTFVSGYDGSPVAAQVAGSEAELTVSAAGFLTLKTVDRHRIISLWPNDNRVTLQDTFQFVYGGSDFNPLQRLQDSTTTVGVVPVGALANEPAVAAGVAELNGLLAAAETNLRYVVGDSGQVRVDLVIDPGDPIFADPNNRPGAAVYNLRQGNALVGGRVVIYDLEQARIRPTIAHELLHTLGLGHSIHPGPMMNSADLYSHPDFTELDRLFVRFVRMRQPGTRIDYTSATENDRGAVTPSGRSLETDVIVCQ